MRTNQALNFDDTSPYALVSVIAKTGNTPPRYLNERNLGVTYVDSGKRSTTLLTVDLANEDEELFNDDDLMRNGTILDVSFGYPGMMRSPGQFVTKDPSGSYGKLTLTAHERKRSKMVRKRLVRIWDDARRADVVRQVLGEDGFPTDQIHVDPTPEILQSITQRNEHNWQFVQRLAQLQGHELWIERDGVHWQRPKRNQRPSRLLRYVKNPIGIGEIITYSFSGSRAGLPGRVTLKGKNPLTKKPFAAVSDRTTAANYIELTETSGAETPEEGDRTDRGDTGHEVIQWTGSRTLEEAKNASDMMYKAARYGALKLQLTTIGDPTLRSRTVIAVYGLGTAFDGLWWVKRVTHTFKAGYRCSLDLAREGLAKRLGIKKKKKPQTINEEVNAVLSEVGGSLRGFYGGFGSV